MTERARRAAVTKIERIKRISTEYLAKVVRFEKEGNLNEAGKFDFLIRRKEVSIGISAPDLQHLQG